jgi:hypothetical protein
MIVSSSEKEDFASALDRDGYAKEDFEILAREDPFPTQDIGHITGAVTVRNKKIGFEQTYKAGHTTAWVAEFERDLQTGLFGRSK